MTLPKPFSGFEFLIAWRYLQAKRSEGGISTMTVISVIGIVLAVAALVIVLAVRTGFRGEFVDTIVGANAHLTVEVAGFDPETNTVQNSITDYNDMAARIAAVDGVTRAAPLIRGQVLGSSGDRNAAVDVFGINLQDLKTLPRIARPDVFYGNIDDLQGGIAIGTGLARELRLIVGDHIKLISPNGLKTAFGTSPRVMSYQVVYVFEAGRWDIDRTRAYLPFETAQEFFNREGGADQIEILVNDINAVEDLAFDVQAAASPRAFVYTWKSTSGAFLRALQVEDNAMFIIMAVLVLLATMNIVSGLIMLVKNKSKDIGILRTIGLGQGSILRIFFICGASIGFTGTVIGALLGVVFVIYIDPIFMAINYISGGGVWDPSVRYIYNLPAELRAWDVLRAVSLSMFLSCVITIFPALRASRLNPVEAMRYE